MKLFAKASAFNISKSILACVMASSVFGCATQAPQIAQIEAPHAKSSLRTAQAEVAKQAPLTPVLKRKIALGRITNETNYGQSLLRDNQNDPLGKQVTDLMSKSLTETGEFLVFERPDIGRVQAESRLVDSKLRLVGVDTLIVGSLTEFGRKTIGASGFVSANKKQIAFAKVDIRLVDTQTGHVFYSTAGSGEASTETGSVFGFGSQASYDGTLNDAAIRQAVGDAINSMTVELNKKPWETYILKIEGGRVFIGGGKSQGIKQGRVFGVFTLGEKIKSPQTGAEVTLPGKSVAQVRVDALFGDTELNEGAIVSVASGSIAKYRPNQLVIRYEGN
jgi:curli biogenesis system outer membrane secretion channel CsgG